MANINLLPRERVTGKDVSRAQALLKKISISLAIVFFLVIGVLGGFYFFSLNNLNTLRAKYDNLSSQVASLQSTEASLVFLKDRLQKAQTILASRTNEGYLAKQMALLENAPEDVAFKESTVDSSMSSLKVETKSSTALQTLLSNLLASNDFSLLVIKELTFDISSGYSILFNVL